MLVVSHAISSFSRSRMSGRTVRCRRHRHSLSSSEFVWRVLEKSWLENSPHWFHIKIPKSRDSLALARLMLAGVRACVYCLYSHENHRHVACTQQNSASRGVCQSAGNDQDQDDDDDGRQCYVCFSLNLYYTRAYVLAK